MLVLPENHSPLMQTYLGDPTNDADLDAEPNFRPVHWGDDPSIVYHEYTHGLEGRLVTDDAGFVALNGAQAGAIDEGTADWYALDYLVETGEIPDDEDQPDVTIGRYAVAGPTGLRTQAIDCPVGAVAAACPDAGEGAGPGGYTFGDFGKVIGGAEIHADGEIWAQTLWQLRRSLIAVHGSSDGMERARRLVTDGLRLAPRYPTFLDMRNAILLSDVQAGGGDRSLIWDVFRSRGMGYAASARGTDDVQPLADGSGPPAPETPVGALAGTVRDQDTGAPIAGALVAFAGHDSGLDEDLATHTGADGSYSIAGVPARTWSHVTIAPAAGYDRSVASLVTVTAGATARRDFAVRRNWALASGGTTVRSSTGGDYSIYGCGPGSLIDGTPRRAWSANSPSNVADRGSKEVVLQLPQPITLGEVRIDPSPGCGDPAAAALAGFQLQVSPDASNWTTVSQGVFTSANTGHVNSVGLMARPAGVRYVKVRGLGTQGASNYMDVAELQVFAEGPKPPVVVPPSTPPAVTPARLRILTKRARLGRRRAFAIRIAGPKGARARAAVSVRIRRGSASRRMTLASRSFRLSSGSGTARLVVRISRKALRRVHARRLKVTVTVRAAGQRRTATVSVLRPRARRR
jgi:hypothetical protein